MEAMQHFSQRFKALREEAGLNQSEIAEKLGVSRGSISFYENGDRVPDIEFLYKASSFFQVTADYLIGTSNARAAEYHSFVEQTGFDSLTIEHLLRIAGHGKKEWCYEYNRAAFELFLFSNKFEDLMENLRSYLEMTISCERVDGLPDMIISLDDQARKISKNNLCVLPTKMASEIFLNRAKETINDLFLDVKRLADKGGGWGQYLPGGELYNVEEKHG